MDARPLVVKRFLEKDISLLSGREILLYPRVCIILYTWVKVKTLYFFEAYLFNNLRNYIKAFTTIYSFLKKNLKGFRIFLKMGYTLSHQYLILSGDKKIIHIHTCIKKNIYSKKVVT